MRFRVWGKGLGSASPRPLDPFDLIQTSSKVMSELFSTKITPIP